MPLANGPAGYGSLTKALHWLTVLLLLTQFTVGYLLDVDDSGHGRGRGRGRGGESGRGRGRGGDADAEGWLALLDDPEPLVLVHVGLGLTILAIAVMRVCWRQVGSLPPWAECLGPLERRLAHLTEVALLGLLFVIPLTGLPLLAGDDDVLWLHVSAHIAFFVALALHVGLVLKHQVAGHRLLGRML